MSIETNAKYLALCESISKAIISGDLEKKLDVLKLQAGELGIEGSDFDALVEQQKKSVDKLQKDQKTISKHKGLLIIICLVAIAIEWVIGVRGGISLWTVIWLLFINLLTTMVIIFGVSYFINKK